MGVIWELQNKGSLCTKSLYVDKIYFFHSQFENANLESHYKSLSSFGPIAEIMMDLWITFHLLDYVRLEMRGQIWPKERLYYFTFC